MTSPRASSQSRLRLTPIGWPARLAHVAHARVGRHQIANGSAPVVQDEQLGVRVVLPQELRDRLRHEPRGDLPSA